MADIDDAALLIAVRRRYELGRLRLALVRASPIVVLLGLAFMATHAMSTVLAAGVPLLALAIAMHWRSTFHGRAVMPGVAAGVIPLTAMRAAQLYGHACTPGACFSVCIPACAVSGVVAGIIIGRLEGRSRAPLSVWVAAVSLAVLTGALSCACVGAAGLAGLAVGVLVGATPAAIGQVVSARRS